MRIERTLPALRARGSELCRFTLLLVFATCVSLFDPSAYSTASACPRLSGACYGWLKGSGVGCNFGGLLSATEQGPLEGAMDRWTGANLVNCSFVSFTTSSSPGAPVKWKTVEKPSTTPVLQASVSANSATRFTQSLTATINRTHPLIDKSVASYNSMLTKLGLQALGASMGLEAPPPPCPAAGDTVMAPLYCPQIQVNDANNYLPSELNCDATKISQIDQYHCPGPGFPKPVFTICIGGNPLKLSSIPIGCDSPILIDVDGNGFPLTNWDTGVLFDMAGDGQLEHTAWTTTSSTNYWLALDRNGNGKIENGLELFGNRTNQPPSELPNGYRALAVFDTATHGGNGDGFITAADAVYPFLLGWRDSNHNGTGEASELTSLASAGILSIALEYQGGSTTDEFGNLFAFNSAAAVRDRSGVVRVRKTTDVYLVSAVQVGKSNVERDHEPGHDASLAQGLPVEQRGSLGRHGRKR